MSPEENKAIVRRMFEEAFNQGNLAILDECVAPDYLDHSPVPIPVPGIEGWKQRIAGYRTGFPDVQFTIEPLLAEADLVALRWTVRATHLGTFGGIPPTGKPVTFTGLNMERMASGKIIENWSEFDLSSLLRQLGAIPSPGQASE